MKTVIASIAALGLIASPALAATKPAPKTSTAAQAKAEGESVKTEAKEKKAAKHHAATCSCPKVAKAHKATHKTAAKSTKTTAKKTTKG